jgi:hypothetical protein
MMTRAAMPGWNDFFVAEAGAAGIFAAWVLLIEVQR